MIKRILTYAVVIVALAYALDWAVLEGLRRNKQGIYDKYTTTFLEHNDYETIMLGSSRMFMHLDNPLFDSITRTHSYNIGLPGATTRMSYACLKAYLVNSSLPKRIFYELDFHISHLRTDTVYNFATYFPYLSNPELYRQFAAIDHRFIGFRYVPFYSLPYLGIRSLSASVNGWTGRSGYYDNYFTQGFFRNELKDGYNNVQVKRYYGYICPESRDYLDSLIQFCHGNQVELIFTMSPTYEAAGNEVANRSRIIAQYAAIARFNGLKLLNYSSDTTISTRSSYFEDNYHMLYPGARIYTRKIAADFNNISHGNPL